MQISRFLVVDPRQRYTAGEALAHPFFQQYDVEEVRHFSPFRKFKVRMRLGAAGASTGMGFPAGAGFLGGCGSLGAEQAIPHGRELREKLPLTSKKKPLKEL